MNSYLNIQIIKRHEFEMRRYALFHIVIFLRGSAFRKSGFNSTPVNFVSTNKFAVNKGDDTLLVVNKIHIKYVLKKFI